MLDFTQHPDKPSLRLLVLHGDGQHEFAYTSGAEQALERAAKERLDDRQDQERLGHSLLAYASVKRAIARLPFPGKRKSALPTVQYAGEPYLASTGPHGTRSSPRSSPRASPQVAEGGVSGGATVYKTVGFVGGRGRQGLAGQGVPAACPIGGVTADSHGLSRLAPGDPQVRSRRRRWPGVSAPGSALRAPAQRGFRSVRQERAPFGWLRPAIKNVRCIVTSRGSWPRRQGVRRFRW
jgi:hypothetical protein